MQSVPLLLYPSGITLIIGLLCWAVGKRSLWTVRILTFISVTIALLLCAWNGLQSGAQWRLPTPWLQLDFLELSIALKITTFGGFLATAACFFTLLIVLYSFSSDRRFSSPGKYYAYVLWSLCGSIGVFYAHDLFFLLVCWEWTTLSLYLLINLGREDTAPAGAAKTFALLGFSDCAMLLGIAFVLASQGTLHMEGLRMVTDSPITIAAYLLFLCAALAKAGALPFHSWIPTASEGAPLTVMALLPASIDKLMGIYLLARVSFGLFELDYRLRALLMTIGALTILAAVFMALVQHDLRRLLSFHAVSQVGYMVLGLGTGSLLGMAGGLFHMLNHAIYKSSLFLCAGDVEERTGEHELDRLGGLGRFMPLTFLACSIAALAISGVPPLNGFVSKWMIYQALLSEGSSLGVVFLAAAVFGSALTLASFVKVIHSCFWGTRPEGLKVHPASTNWAVAIPMLVLALLCIGLGLWAVYPVHYFFLIAGAELHSPTLPPAEIQPLVFETGLWSPGAATNLVLLGILLGLIVYGIGRGLKYRVTRNYLAGEILTEPQVRYSGTSFYESVRELPVLQTLFKDGQSGAYDLYRLGGRYGNSLVQVLRGMHSGVLLIYVSWCIVGLILILGYLLQD